MRRWITEKLPVVGLIKVKGMCYLERNLHLKYINRIPELLPNTACKQLSILVVCHNSSLINPSIKWAAVRFHSQFVTEKKFALSNQYPENNNEQQKNIPVYFVNNQRFIPIFPLEKSRLIERTGGYHHSNTTADVITPDRSSTLQYMKGMQSSLSPL